VWNKSSWSKTMTLLGGTNLQRFLLILETSAPLMRSVMAKAPYANMRKGVASSTYRVTGESWCEVRVKFKVGACEDENECSRGSIDIAAVP